MRVNPNFTTSIVPMIETARQNADTAAEQVSTGRDVNSPSDNPASAAGMVEEDTMLARNEQYTTNSESLYNMMDTADSALSSVITELDRAITLGTEGANGTMNTTDMTSIASELSGIKSTVMSLANTSYNGTYLFGGTEVATAPYSVDATDSTVIDYNGNSDTNTVNVGNSLSVTSNMAGSSIFNQSGADVFTSLQSMITALQNGNQTAVAGSVTSVKAALDAVSTAQVFYSNSMSQLTTQESFLSTDKVNIASEQNTLVASDTATSVANELQANTAVEATIAAVAKLTSKSLIDYIS